MLKIKNIAFKYNKQKVLDHVSCEIKSGDVFALLGHNGAGKTTMFRIIMGLLPPSNGQVIFTDTNMKKKGFNYISFLPENNGIYENLTAYRNLEFRGRISNLPLKIIKENSQKLLKKFKLINRGNEKAYTWSNGMKKRLGLASAMITKPRILILDEPTNGIDPESLNILTKTMKELQDEGTTIIFSSHNLDFVSKVSTKVMILQNGKKVFSSEMKNINEPLENLYLKHTESLEE
ncbi:MULTISPECIES: ABC transporter ATP-binding protein [Clostridium]|uniref:ABC transporter ATP-binding protein n=1 Tax=Clostridium TaxID=1485 RepID=UPI000E089DAF|nr:ABC transporter ATP-binding protein [Clostridium sporogenes]MCW6086528.1 ABC transporter ATP-binding protein [Clostridium sporogenes]STE73765.1 sulfate-transporting ATPase [Clostridium botulinum]